MIYLYLAFSSILAPPSPVRSLQSILWCPTLLWRKRPPAPIYSRFSPSWIRLPDGRSRCSFKTDTEDERRPSTTDDRTTDHRRQTFTTVRRTFSRISSFLNLSLSSFMHVEICTQQQHCRWKWMKWMPPMMMNGVWVIIIYQTVIDCKMRQDV